MADSIRVLPSTSEFTAYLDYSEPPPRKVIGLRAFLAALIPAAFGLKDSTMNPPKPYRLGRKTPRVRFLYRSPKPEQLQALGAKYSEKRANNHVKVKGNPFLGIKGTHQYVARISRGQMTRRMRALRGPILAGTGE